MSIEAAPSCFSIPAQRRLTKGQTLLQAFTSYSHLAPKHPRVTRPRRSRLWLCWLIKQNFWCLALKFILRHFIGVFSKFFFFFSSWAIIFLLQINLISWNYYSKWCTIHFPFSNCCSDVRSKLSPYWIITLMSHWCSWPQSPSHINTKGLPVKTRVVSPPLRAIPERNSFGMILLQKAVSTEESVNFSK